MHFPLGIRRYLGILTFTRFEAIFITSSNYSNELSELSMLAGSMLGKRLSRRGFLLLARRARELLCSGASFTAMMDSHNNHLQSYLHFVSRNYIPSNPETL
jgi:hypothetical protein